MPAREAGWDIEATMGQFFPDSVFRNPSEQNPYRHAREFYVTHEEMLLDQRTSLIGRLTLPENGKLDLQAEEHLTSDMASRTVSLGFSVEGSRSFSWILSSGAYRYELGLRPGRILNPELYVRTNQNSLLRHVTLTDACAGLAVHDAVTYLAGHRGTKQTIAALQGGSEKSRRAADAIKDKQAHGLSLTKVERDALAKYKPTGFPPGPWTSMAGKTPLIGS